MTSRLIIEKLTLADIEREILAREQLELTALNAELARRSLYEFVLQAWHVLEPGVEMATGWHIEAICLHLEAVSRGEIQHLLINVPPGHMKSLLTNVFWPAWVWLHNPAWRVIFATYAQNLTERDSGKCRDLIQSQWYQETFQPTWKLSEDQNTKAFFTNTAGGFRLSLSRDGQGTGYRGDCIVCDDPMSAEEAFSEAVLKRVVRWWDKTMSTRLSRPKEGAKVIIMQRLHQDDLSGHVIKKKTYQHLKLASEFNNKLKSVTYLKKKDPKTGGVYFEKFWEDPRTKDGELLFESLFDAEVLAQAKIDLGSDGYAGQHLQEPSDPEGSMFKKKWWGFWRPKDAAGIGTAPRPDGCNNRLAVVLPELDKIVISLDCAFKDKETSDFVVFTVWGCHQANRYLLDVERGRMSFSLTVETLKKISARHPRAYAKLVEDKANGSAVIDTLKNKINGIVAIEPRGGKRARAAAIQPQVEAGNVFLPEGAPFLADFVEELGAFPKGANDDQVDSTSQALLHEMNSAAGLYQV
jgi:predicted phage terminase large subunit-like protein